jgi:dTDP-4-amino-4,6-dideoxygalactose transaminase
MTYTETLAERLIRLPLWAGMTMGDVAYTVDQVKVALAGV